MYYYGNMPITSSLFNTLNKNSAIPYPREIKHLGIFLPLPNDMVIYSCFTSQDMTTLPFNIKIPNYVDILYPYERINPPLLMQKAVFDDFITISNRIEDVPVGIRNKIPYDQKNNRNKLMILGFDSFFQNLSNNNYTSEYMAEKRELMNNVLKKNTCSFKYRKLTLGEKTNYSKFIKNLYKKKSKFIDIFLKII
jgi:hypothetical protein